ncbi:hypothetical protein PMAYCL1PPCAC_05549, partial [Pristionchus mayeri]
LFVLLRSLLTGVTEVFSVLITVLLAEQFTGNYVPPHSPRHDVLSTNLSAFSLIATPIAGLFVENKLAWQLGVSVAPVLMIPALVLSVITLRSSKSQVVPHPLAILKNAIGVFRIPSLTIMLVSMCVDMFYAGPFMFWMIPLRLYAMEAYPEIFLGLSYTVITTLTSTVSFIGGLAGSVTVPYLTHKLESGSGVCSCLTPVALALPLAYGFSQLIQTLSYLVEILSLTRNFPIFLASFFMSGFIGAGLSLTIVRIKLAITPANQRSSAISVNPLVITIACLPSSQIFAAISDSIRGESTASIDHLEALQETFIYTWAIPLASSVLGFLLLRFYRRDVKKAKEIDAAKEEESTP